ncbi:hypothetical protein [Streptomyces sp. NPDC047014]|uniref:hypothetical protein n=1 Tax=Streptomyces sp. NPDC047014 TaxID=3155736 RepID=UPI0033F77DF9
MADGTCKQIEESAFRHETGTPFAHVGRLVIMHGYTGKGYHRHEEGEARGHHS